jgi:hypothetical protein
VQNFHTKKAAHKMLVKLTSGVFFWLLVYPVSVEKTLLEGTQSDASLSSLSIKYSDHRKKMREKTFFPAPSHYSLVEGLQSQPPTYLHFKLIYILKQASAFLTSVVYFHPIGSHT